MSSGFAIAMTDLFFSSSGALLLVLAMLRPTPDIPLPVQADLFAHCPTGQALETGGATLRMETPAGDREVAVKTVDALATAPQALGLSPALFYTIALMPDEAGLLSARCLKWVQDDLVRDHNARIGERLDRGGARPVFGVTVVSGRKDEPEP